MTNRTKRILKGVGVAVAALVVLAGAAAAWLQSILPKVKGPPPVIQTELFAPPTRAVTGGGLFRGKSASELAGMIRRREATSEAITRDLLADIRSRNHLYNALVWLRDEEALADARRADEVVARGEPLGPLHGVPVTIKEMFWVKGSPSTLNASMTRFTAPKDGPVAEAMRKAGAIVLGTTNVPANLADYQTVGEIYPTARNPYDTTRTPGGSTGGGAAAVAAGLSPLEIGSDLGGSVRVPSAFCGLWGLKATVGAINITEATGPDIGQSFTRFAMASPGPLARSPADLELAWAALRDTAIDPHFQHPMTWKPASERALKDYRFAWIDEWAPPRGYPTVGEPLKARLARLVSSLGSAGATVERSAPDLHARLERHAMSTFALMMGEGQPWLVRQFIKADLRKFDDKSGAIAVLDEVMADPSDARWQAAVQEGEALRAQMEAFFTRHDFLIAPITYGPAFTHRDKGAPIEVDGHTIPYAGYVANGLVINATGHPTLSVPLGLDDKGLPLGVQVVGPWQSEPELLHLARLLEPLVPGFVPPPTDGVPGARSASRSD